MKNTVRICLFCRSKLSEQHGNRRYHEECAYEAKKRRSVERYAVQQVQIDPSWRNEKFLRELYYKYGPHVELDTDLLTTEGFELKIYTSVKEYQGYKVIVMKHFGYSMLKNLKVIIWKI